MDVDEEAGKSKPATLIAFQESVRGYLSSEARQISHGEGEALNSVGFASVDKRALFRDARATLTHLVDMQKASKERSKWLQIGNPATIDYTSLLVAKFLQGVAPWDEPLRVFRSHVLFGAWQSSRFDDLYSTVHELMA